jgi:hypothetical protein
MVWFAGKAARLKLNIYSFLLGEVGENPTLTRNRKSAKSA